jgi:hypothetical protein
MRTSLRYARRCSIAALLCGTVMLAVPASICAQPAQKTVVAAAAEAPELDLTVTYYSRILTPEGVLRESRYQEKILRRIGHVWMARILPKIVADEHAHKHFNHVVLARHVTLDGDRLRLDFVDAHERAVVAIAPTEYENVNFDGSWANAFYLVDPQDVALLPLSGRASPVVGARWHEREKNGLFQRVLWDDKRMLPLIVETGDRTSDALRRIEVKPQAGLTRELPWLSLKGYEQKENADFLD